MFTEVFQGLSASYKLVHIFSFVLITISILMLVSVAPYHRIRERGKNTGRTLWYVNTMLLTSMFVTATGISVDVWLVCALADLAALAAWAPTLRAGVFVAVSMVTKLGSAYLGALRAP